MIRRLAAVIAVVVSAVACGKPGPSAADLDQASADCTRLAATDERLAGQVQGILTTNIGVCTVGVRAGSSALRALGVSSACPPEASIALAMRVTNDTLVLDRAKTQQLDNGECALTFEN